MPLRPRTLSLAIVGALTLGSSTVVAEKLSPSRSSAMHVLRCRGWRARALSRGLAEVERSKDPLVQVQRRVLAQRRRFEAEVIRTMSNEHVTAEQYGKLQELYFALPTKYPGTRGPKLWRRLVGKSTAKLTAAERAGLRLNGKVWMEEMGLRNLAQVLESGANFNRQMFRNGKAHIVGPERDIDEAVIEFFGGDGSGYHRAR